MMDFFMSGLNLTVCHFLFLISALKQQIFLADYDTVTLLVCSTPLSVLQSNLVTVW